MILMNLSNKEKDCFCALLLAAICEDSRITEGEIDVLIRYRIELDVEDISSSYSYEEALAWLNRHSSDLTKRAILLELISLMYDDEWLTTDENNLIKDVARRFKINNLSAFVKTGKALSQVYNQVYPLFEDVLS